MELWNAQVNLSKIKNTALDKLKEQSKNKSFIYIFTTEDCPHCKIFKKDQLDTLLEKIKGVYTYKLCDVGKSSYYLNILQSANVNQVPTILRFQKGGVKSYSPDEFLSTI